MKRLLFLAVILLVLLVSALPAFAGDRVISGTLDTNDPIYVNGRPDFSDCSGQIDDLLPEKYRYESYLVSVTVSGVYGYEDLFNAIDIEVAVYPNGTFDPANPRANCIRSMDDNNTVEMNAGVTYRLVVTSYDIPTTGTYAFRMSGPGDIVLRAADLNCPVPRPSSFTLRSLPAGAPAFHAADLGSQTTFNIPAGTWYMGNASGDFTQLWVACRASMVWVPTNAVAP